MSAEWDDLEVQVDEEWAELEGRLADRLASMLDDEVLHLEVMTALDDDDLDGGVPSLDVASWGGGRLRAEVSGNASLDQRFLLDESAVEALVGLGWQETVADLVVVGEVRDADRVAMMAVAALRGVFGCPSPAFLLGDLAQPAAVVPAFDVDDEPEDDMSFPEDHDHLRALVDKALAVAHERPLRYDDDGDFPVACGGSTVFVRVLPDRPAIELFAELAVGVVDQERLTLELDVLNRSHAVAKFFTAGDRVVMRHTLPAVPFVPGQLRMFLHLMCGEVDQVAGDLIARVGGQRPGEAAAAAEVEAFLADVVADETHPALVALFELLHDDDVAHAEVAALFDGDRHELVVQLVALRTGRQTCHEHDLDVVLAHLRGALRFIVERQARADAPATLPVPPRPHSQQLSLIPDESTLDEGRWDQEVG